MYHMDKTPVPGRDPIFLESISKTMRVPDRLSVGPGQDQDQDLNQTDARPIYSMQVPDRLTYTEAPDLSPRPLFSPKSKGPGLEVCWESPEGPHRETQQSPIRRSLSDQSFARTPPGTPTQNRALVVPRQQPSARRAVRRPPVVPSLTTASEPPLPVSARSIMQMGVQASQRLLQAINGKYRFTREAPRPEPVADQSQVDPSRRRAEGNWSADVDGGAAVELIVLRRQVLKMSRRLAALERHNSERRNTEFVLFCLLGSACLLNAWLWIRR